MEKAVIFVLGLMLLFNASIAEEKLEVSVVTMPPVVIKTFPVAGDTEVDPDINEIRVTFSKKMRTERMWSFVKISNDTYPEVIGDVKYMEDKRTCVLPVKLEPGRTYVIWFNTEKFNSFRDINNFSSVPYLLVFQTRARSGSPAN